MINNSTSLTEKLVEMTRGRYYGKYRGEVESNNDPFNRGRLEVSVPSLLHSETVWALPCVPYGGKDAGLFMIPDKGTRVWVEFEGGDLSFPIWTGCYWGDDESPKDNKLEEPKVRLIKSASGLTISLDDDDEVVTISDRNNDNTITIDVNGGTIKIKANSSIVVEAQSVQLGGQEAFQPLVKGADLLVYLNALVLAAQPKAGVIPVPPPSLLSQKVKTV